MSKELKKSLVEIKLITGTDAEGYIDLKQRSWLDTYPNDEYGISYDDIYKLVTHKPLKDRIQQTIFEIQNNQKLSVYIIHVDKKVAGFVNYQLSSSTKGKIQEIYLAPEYVGRSYGGMLMVFTIDKLRELEIKEITAEVAKYNLRAIKFYEDFGFVIEGDYENCFKINDKVYMPIIKLKKFL